MPIQLTESKKESGIPVYFLKKGQIARIVSWSIKHYVGYVVQRSGDYLFAIGKDAVWEDLFFDKDEDCQVVIIKDGSLLEITDNQ